MAWERNKLACSSTGVHPRDLPPVVVHDMLSAVHTMMLASQRLFQIYHAVRQPQLCSCSALAVLTEQWMVAKPNEAHDTRKPSLMQGLHRHTAWDSWTKAHLSSAAPGSNTTHTKTCWGCPPPDTCCCSADGPICCQHHTHTLHTARPLQAHSGQQQRGQHSSESSNTQVQSIADAVDACQVTSSAVVLTW